MPRLSPALILAAVILSLASCSTKSADEVNPITNKWTVGADEYTPQVLTDTLNTITAATGVGTTRSSLTLIFNADTLPAAGGKYRVVGNLMPAANELSFVTGSYNSGATTAYAASGLDSQYATVTVTGRKVEVVMPAVRAKNIANPADSLRVSATIQQF